ncbi:MAG TPA: COX15/CtaA family protein [Burkholderiales bacterium]|nr:COX15/CtaA family protein [Burkholderiales bacterium]
MNPLSADMTSIDSGGAPEARSKSVVAAWLLVCCALVFAMVVVGGVTRLTHSGLSIVEWQPIIGAVPPLGQAQWAETFDQYKLTPEYRKINEGMSLAAFKSIFWWEYFHRLLGRTIGFVFLLPLIWFWRRGRIDRPLALWLTGIFVLGGLQGAMGWYMVKSGLVDDPRVSQYRLTAHLAIALAIYAAMLWTALGLLYSGAGAAGAGQPRLRRFSWVITALVAYMVFTGGFVAGTHAGFAYNTFPLMNGHWVPPEIFMLRPWPLNFFNNLATVQFDHRLGAWLLALLVPWFWLKARGVALTPRARLAANLLLGMLALQITLGLSTLLLVVPVPLAAAHQAGAVLLLTAALLANHALR